MGKGKIQKGLRTDGTELASGILSTMIKRIRGQNSKRTQREGKRKCVLGCTTQYKLEEFFLALPRDCQGHFGRCVSQHTKKKPGTAQKQKAERERIQEVLKKSDELGEEVFCGWRQDLSPTWHLCFAPQALLCLCCF